MLPVRVLKVILRLGLAAQLREVNLITDYLPEIENESTLAKMFACVLAPRNARYSTCNLFCLDTKWFRVMLCFSLSVRALASGEPGPDGASTIYS